MDDAALAELNGVNGAVLTNPDPVPDAAPDAAKDLEVAPADFSPKPRAAQLDKVHSVKAGGRGYRITVEGEYYAKSQEGGKSIKKPYKLDFNLPYLIHPTTGAGALGIIVGKLLKPMLLKRFPDAITYRTHEIRDTVPLSKDTPMPNSLQYMGFEQLRAYVLTHNIPIDPANYFEVSELREAVIDHKLNPKGFEEREAKRVEERREERELRQMNPELTDAHAGLDPMEVL